MTTSLSYVAVRDDKAVRSLSVNEREFLRSCAHAPTIRRLDGRRGDEIRKVRMKLGRWDNGAECTVQWGVGTRVTALCTAELVPPSPDRPNAGTMNFTVDLSPMAGTAFRQAPAVGTAPIGSTPTSRGPNFADKAQRLLSNRILRSIERVVLLGGALDFEALVLIPGSWVWRVTVALTVMDDGGNILDACIMAAMATLRHYRKPQVDVGKNVDDQQDIATPALPTLIPTAIKEPAPLPLHHTPLSISFALIPSNDNEPLSNVATLVDPEKREELVQFGALTVAMNTHMEVCLLDYAGGHELSPHKLKACLTTAAIAVKHLCVELETALEQADQEAQKEILQLLHLRRSGITAAATESNSYEGTLEASPLPAVEGMDDNMMIEKRNFESSTNDYTSSEAEELYRQQALDYAVGHVASAVREDASNNEERKSNSLLDGSLFSSLLKAAGSSDGSSPKRQGPPGHVENKIIASVKEETKSLVKAPAVAALSSRDPAKESDEEEESTIMLSSEFGSATPQPQEDETMIDDLSLGIRNTTKR